jgi:hypothetical protein
MASRGRPYTVDYYTLDPTRFAFTGGNLLLNGDREVDYFGASLTLIKRLSNQWMLRGFVNYGKPTWDIPESFFEFDDPTDNDAFNNDDLYTVDLRLEKEFQAWGQSSFILSADVFNALNAGTVLPREAGLNLPIANFVLETLSPRIWRLGVRVNWR